MDVRLNQSMSGIPAFSNGSDQLSPADPLAILNVDAFEMSIPSFETAGMLDHDIVAHAIFNFPDDGCSGLGCSDRGADGSNQVDPSVRPTAAAAGPKLSGSVWIFSNLKRWTGYRSEKNRFLDLKPPGGERRVDWDEQQHRD